MFLNGVPLVTVMAAALMLGERLTSLQITGGLMIIAAFITSLPLNGQGKGNTT